MERFKIEPNGRTFREEYVDYTAKPILIRSLRRIGLYYAEVLSHFIRIYGGKPKKSIKSKIKGVFVGVSADTPTELKDNLFVRAVSEVFNSGDNKKIILKFIIGVLNLNNMLSVISSGRDGNADVDKSVSYLVDSTYEYLYGKLMKYGSSITPEEVKVYMKRYILDHVIPFMYTIVQKEDIVSNKGVATTSVHSEVQVVFGKDDNGVLRSSTLNGEVVRSFNFGCFGISSDAGATGYDGFVYTPKTIHDYLDDTFFKKLLRPIEMFPYYVHEYFKDDKFKRYGELPKFRFGMITPELREKSANIAPRIRNFIYNSPQNYRYKFDLIDYQKLSSYETREMILEKMMERMESVFNNKINSVVEHFERFVKTRVDTYTEFNELTEEMFGVKCTSFYQDNCYFDFPACPWRTRLWTSIFTNSNKKETIHTPGSLATIPLHLYPLRIEEYPFSMCLEFDIRDVG